MHMPVKLSIAKVNVNQSSSKREFSYGSNLSKDGSNERKGKFEMSSDKRVAKLSKNAQQIELLEPPLRS